MLIVGKKIDGCALARGGSRGVSQSALAGLRGLTEEQVPGGDGSGDQACDRAGLRRPSTVLRARPRVYWSHSYLFSLG